MNLNTPIDIWVDEEGGDTLTCCRAKCMLFGFEAELKVLMMSPRRWLWEAKYYGTTMTEARGNCPTLECAKDTAEFFVQNIHKQIVRKMRTP